MGTKYIVIEKCIAHKKESTFALEWKDVAGIGNIVYLSPGDIIIESTVSQEAITETHNSKKYTFWLMNVNGKKYYINKDHFVKIKKRYLNKKTKRKTASGTIKDSYKYKSKGYLVYLLEKSLKPGNNLNKCWMVDAKTVGYFYGSELSSTNPNKKQNQDIISSGDSSDISSINENASKSYKETMASKLIPCGIPYGLFPQSKIEYKKFTRFFRDPVIDPNNKITGTKEYLFFTKPDLHLLEEYGNGLILNPELANSTFFKEMRSRYPDLLVQLQMSADASKLNDRYNTSYCPYLSQILSYYCTGNLELNATSAKTIDTPETIFGNSIAYRDDGHEGEFNIDFSISFKDDKYGIMYNYFKIWEEYSKLKKEGLVTPPKQWYTTEKILHDQIGIWKFIVAEDGETILYYAYICGAFPLTVPRDSFSNLTENPTYTIDWHGFHIDDVNPEILSDFNFVASAKKSRGAFYQGSNDSSFNEVIKNLAPMYDDKLDDIYRYPMYHPYVYAVKNKGATKTIYKLVWRKIGDNEYNSYNENFNISLPKIK